MEVNGTMSIPYSYDVLRDNFNLRTIQEFSLSARARYFECDGGCPFPVYGKYLSYYGVFDYANVWIMSALTGVNSPFPNTNFLSFDIPSRGSK